jgi:hypothetical protein
MEMCGTVTVSPERRQKKSLEAQKDIEVSLSLVLEVHWTYGR